MEKSTIKRGLILTVAVLIFVLSTVGCKAKMGKSVEYSAANENGAANDRYTAGTNEDKSEFNNTASKAQISGTQDSGNKSALTGRKIIRSADIYAQTLDYDKSLTALNKLISDFGGYIQDSRVEAGVGYNEEKYRTAQYTIRIPAARFDEFLNKTGEIGSIITKNSKGDDISDQYFDTQAHLEALKIQEQRLLELLKKASQLSDILQLEKELTDIRYQIEQLTGTIKKWDAVIDVSTVTLKLEEVRKITEEKPEGFLQNLSNTFVGSINALLEFLKIVAVIFTAVLPFAVFFGLIAAIIIFIIRKVSKKK